MIFGLLIRFIIAFLRRRGLKVPDPSRLRRRQSISSQYTNPAIEKLAEKQDNYIKKSKKAK
jgi:hypothetical protein